MTIVVPKSGAIYDPHNDQRARQALEESARDNNLRLNNMQTRYGTLSLSDAAITLASGANNDVYPGYGTYAQISGPTAAFSITGIEHGALGRLLVIRNPTAYTMTIAHQSGSSSAANRIITSIAADVEMAAGTTAILIYNAAASRWHLVDPVALSLTLTALTVGTLTVTGTATMPNEGLHLLDANASHDLIIKPGSDLSADRTLTLATGDASRTLTLGADSSISGTAYVSGGTDVALADGGTGQSLADPGGDRGMFWDDSESKVDWLTYSDGLDLTTTTLRAKFVQEVSTFYDTYSSTSTTIPGDNTIPQNTEGTEIMTLAITPKATTNKLRIDVFVIGAGSAAMGVTAALFQDSTANALTCSIANAYTAAANAPVQFSHTMDAGTTSSTTFKVRVGPTSGTFYFNGYSVSRLFGGVMKCTMTITEYTP